MEGWFTVRAEDPALLGSRCTACGTVAFPPTVAFCRNPGCAGQQFDTVELSRRGRVWSCTDARYQPPPPYVAAEPYRPFTLAAVELPAEKMVVLGQAVAGVAVADLPVGAEVELVLDTLYEDDDHDVVVWKWRPVAQTAAGGDGGGGGGGGGHG